MKPTDRDYSIDWLRVLAMANIFLFHTARLFNHEDWHVKNNDYSSAATLFVMLVSQYIMPLFFVLSAFASSQSLAKRSAAQYLQERFNRLMIPLLFGSVFVIAPLQVWIERVTHPPYYAGSFMRFMIHDYFNGFYLFGGNYAWMGLHLWYLLFLFVFSLLTLPLFRLLLKERPWAAVEKIARFASKPHGLWIYIVPLFITECLVNLQPDGIGGRSAGGWSALSYLVFFITGFVMLLDHRSRRTMAKYRWWLLAFAVLLLVGFVAPYLPRETGANPAAGFRVSGTIDYLLMNLARAVTAYSCLFAIFGFGYKHLNFDSPTLGYLNQMVLPFYIVHQTAIVGIGYLVRDWNIAPAFKFAMVATAAIIAITITYEFVIRRFRITRFLFGMKTKAMETSPPAAPAPGRNVV